MEALVGGLDPEGCATHKGQHTEPAVPVHHLAGPRCCDDIGDGLGEQHTPGACKQKCTLFYSQLTESALLVCHLAGLCS